MKILVTGSSGLLASKVISSLETRHEFLKLGRHHEDIPWTLGEIPPSHAYEGIDAIIHFAWSTSNRISDFDLNVGGTLQLIQETKKRAIPFLFVSTVAVDSRSSYGYSKKLAEDFVSNYGGQILRLGLVPGANYLHLGDKRLLVRIAPKIKAIIKVTELSTVIREIESWLNGSCTLPFPAIGPNTSVDYDEDFIELIKRSAKFVLFVPGWSVNIGYSILGRYSLRVRNFYDAFRSISAYTN